MATQPSNPATTLATMPSEADLLYRALLGHGIRSVPGEVYGVSDVSFLREIQRQLHPQIRETLMPTTLSVPIDIDPIVLRVQASMRWPDLQNTITTVQNHTDSLTAHGERLTNHQQLLDALNSRLDAQAQIIQGLVLQIERRGLLDAPVSITASGRTVDLAASRNDRPHDVVEVRPGETLTVSNQPVPQPSGAVDDVGRSATTVAGAPPASTPTVTNRPDSTTTVPSPSAPALDGARTSGPVVTHDQIRAVVATHRSRFGVPATITMLTEVTGQTTGMPNIAAIPQDQCARVLAEITTRLTVA